MNRKLRDIVPFILGRWIFSVEAIIARSKKARKRWTPEDCHRDTPSARTVSPAAAIHAI